MHNSILNKPVFCTTQLVQFIP